VPLHYGGNFALTFGSRIIDESVIKLLADYFIRDSFYVFKIHNHVAFIALRLSDGDIDTISVPVKIFA
jgi:hypothetical protein